MHVRPSSNEEEVGNVDVVLDKYLEGITNSINFSSAAAPFLPLRLRRLSEEELAFFCTDPIHFYFSSCLAQRVSE